MSHYTDMATRRTLEQYGWSTMIAAGIGKEVSANSMPFATAYTDGSRSRYATKQYIAAIAIYTPTKMRQAAETSCDMVWNA